ncbi:hypothetical protein RKD27_000209 [Streptomyces sp. SAI-126]
MGCRPDIRVLFPPCSPRTEAPPTETSPHNVLITKAGGNLPALAIWVYRPNEN